MYHTLQCIRQRQGSRARTHRPKAAGRKRQGPFFSAISHGLLAGGCAALLLGCENGVLSRSPEVVVKAQPPGSTNSFNHLKELTLGADEPLRLDFSSKEELHQLSGSWLFRRTSPTYLSSQGHSQPGSVLVHNRTDTWNGPLLKLPPLKPSQAYRVSVWIHPQDTKKTTSAALVLTRVADGLSTSSKLDEAQMEPNKWHRLSGEFVTSPYKSEQLHTLHFDLSNIAADYLVDDLIVAYAEFSADLEQQLDNQVEQATETEQNTKIAQRQHIRNGDAESGMDYWGHQGGLISSSTVHAHSGKHSILITSRNQSWNAPTMEVRDLQDDTRYRFSVFTRLADDQPPAEMKLTIKRVTDGQASYLPLAEVEATDSDWVEIAGEYSAPNITQSEQVVVYVESTSATVSYYVDTLTVQALP